MKEVNSHIVSSFRWDTTFDRKDNAHELQERLSAWSRFTMPREMAAVFDKICPPEQTWRIKPFELDLGFTSYNNLEQELSEKLRKQLQEKLADLIFYASRHGSGTIEIVDGETSQLNMLAAFLVSGLMPWNYQSADGSVNQLMAYQLQHNRREAIAMIRETGAEHAVVRRRLAWQFNEPVILAVIEGLEPNYHTQVIEFANDVAAIQKKEAIVKTSVADLKKNLWHWILNYLLKERGTLFNKLSFMRSSIRQMAAHYNVAYHELLTLIERAVDTVIEKTTLRSEFVITLKALAQDNLLIKEQAPTTGAETGHWQVLEDLFRKPGLCNTGEKKKEFNELVINLEKQDQAKFTALLVSLGKAEKIWAPAVHNLNNPSLEVVFTALNPTRAQLLVETIYFLHSLTEAVNIKISMKLLWNTGLDFLHQHKNSAFDNAAFTRHCIAAISRHKKISANKLLAQLAMADIQPAAKTLLALEVYNHLSSQALLLNSSSNVVFNTAGFQKLLGRLSRQLSSGALTVAQFEEWQRLFTNYVLGHPSEALDVLVQHAGKQNLAGLTGFVMTMPVMRTLIAAIEHPNAQVLLWLQSATVNLRTGKGTTGERTELREIFNAPETQPGLQSHRLKNKAGQLTKEDVDAMEQQLLAEHAANKGFKINKETKPESEVTDGIEKTSADKTILKDLNGIHTIAGRLNGEIVAPDEAVFKSETGLHNVHTNAVTIPGKEKAAEQEQRDHVQAIAALNKTGNKIIKADMRQGSAKEDAEAQTQGVSTGAVIQSDTTAAGKTEPGKEEPVTELFTAQNASEKRETIQHLFSSLPTEEQAQVKKELIDQLTALGVQLLLKNPAMSQPAFLRRLLKQWHISLPVLQSTYLHQLLLQLPAGEALQAMGITQVVIEKLKETLPASADKFHMAQVQRFTRIYKIPKAPLGQWLLANYRHTEFAALRRQNNAATAELIHYFVPAGQALLETLVKEYGSLPALYLKSGTAITATNILKDIFWRVLLDYPSYSGNAATVKRLFKAAAAIHFNIKEKEFTAFLPVSTGGLHGGWVQLKSGGRLSQAQFYLLAEQCLASANGTVKYRGAQISIAEIIQTALHMEAAPLIKIFSQKQVSKGVANKITADIPFADFILWLMQDSMGELRQTLKALGELPALLGCVIPGAPGRQVTAILWQHTWQLLKNGRVAAGFLENLIGRLFKNSVIKQINSPAQVSELLGSKGIVLGAELIGIINKYLPGITYNKALPPVKAPFEFLTILEDQGVLEDLALYMLKNKSLPAWLYNLPATSIEIPVAELLNGIIVYHPALFLKIYSHRILPQAQSEWLQQVVNFNSLTLAIAQSQGNKRSLLNILAQFHTALGHLAIRGISAKVLQGLLFKKVMKAWAGNNWRLVSTEAVWNELMWNVSSEYGVGKEIFMQAVTKQLTMFPPALQTAFNYLAELHKTAATPALKQAAQKLKPKHRIIPLHNVQNQGSIPVKNAGIVLLQDYVPLLFERLKLVNDKKFNSDAEQADAVHYLQYVATGLTETEEGLLPLNKVLCGLPFSAPLKPGIDMTEGQKILIDGLINAAMGYWPAIGSNSINGFRGNWLVRDGLLTEQEERWELTVDKRAYDLLIHKSPFSFSIIKYPWMDKPLHVNWPY